MRGSYILRFYYKYIPVTDLQVNVYQLQIRRKMRENHGQAGSLSVTKPLCVTKEIFTAIPQHLIILPTLVATSNKIWFNNWSKTQKMKDYLWHWSLTHFCALRYLFQASCRPSQDCKKQSWPSDVKAINCVVTCACGYTVREFMCLLVPDACRTCSS